MRIILTLLFLHLIPNLHGWVKIQHTDRDSKKVVTYLTATHINRDKEIHLLVASCKTVRLVTTTQSPFGEEAIYLRFDSAQPYSALPKKGGVEVSLISEVVAMLKHYNSLYMNYVNLYGETKKARFNLENFNTAYATLDCEVI